MLDFVAQCSDVCFFGFFPDGHCQVVYDQSINPFSSAFVASFTSKEKELAQKQKETTEGQGQSASTKDVAVVATQSQVTTEKAVLFISSAISLSLSFHRQGGLFVCLSFTFNKALLLLLLAPVTSVAVLVTLR